MALERSAVFKVLPDYCPNRTRVVKRETSVRRILCGSCVFLSLAGALANAAPVRPQQDSQVLETLPPYA